MRFTILSFFCTIAFINCFAQISQDTVIIEYVDYDSNQYKSIYVLEKSGLYSYEKYLKNKLIIKSHAKSTKHLSYTGEYVTFYPSGELEIEGLFDIKCRRTGQWKAYYKNSQLKSVATLEKDMFTGPYLSYYENGNIQSEGNFNIILSKDSVQFDSQVGIWKYYHESGGLKMAGAFFNGIAKNMLEKDLKSGEWKYYNEKGELEKIEIYEMGKLVNDH